MSHFTKLLLFCSLTLSFPAQAAKKVVPCPTDFAALDEKKVAPRPYHFKHSRAPDGVVTLDLAGFRNELVAGIAEKNKTAKPPLPAPAKVRVYVDNVLTKELAVTEDTFRLALKADEQYSIRLEAVAKNGRVLERTEHSLLEKTAIRAVNPASYQEEKLIGIRSPLDAANKVDPEMPEVVQKIGRSKIVFVWKNPKDPRVESLKGEVDFRVLRDEQNKITGYTATDATRREKGLPPLAFAKEDAFVKVDAAFNENSFLWDDMFTCLHVLPFDPELCRSTLSFWLDVQKHHSQGLGDIPREVLKSNGTSYNVFETVHLGEVIPNGSYTNPNIMGNVVEQLVDQTGLTPENRKLMRETLDSMAAYGRWMDNHRAIHDKDGKLAGYWITDLGSGMDNIGRAPGENFSRVGYLDELARRIELEKSSARLEARLGNFTAMRKHEARAKELDHLLNSRYWSKEKGFYYDLVPGPNGALVRQEDMPTVAGFWPLFSRSASPEQMKQISDKWYTAQTFGGNFPVRSLPPLMQKLRPGSYYPAGGYWRGGNWAPTDIIKALGEERSGRADLAAHTINKKMAADSYIAAQEVKKGKKKTVYETLGTDEKGNPIPGVQIEADGHVHQTRWDFVGWGGTPHTHGKLRHVLGIRPVPAFGGSVMRRDAWIDFVTRDPLFANTTRFGESALKNDPAQRALFAEGLLEINPPHKIGSAPLELTGYSYRGQPVDLKVYREGKKVKVIVKAGGPVDMNLSLSEAGGAPTRIVKAKSATAGETTLEFDLP